MNATNTNAGGWEKSELRGRFNSGDLWALLPTEIQSKAKFVTKMTDNRGGGKLGTPSATTDKVFLLSSTEVWGDLDWDGTQYEYYKSKGVTKSNCSVVSSIFDHWTRFVYQNDSMSFQLICTDGCRGGSSAAGTTYVLPAWRF